MRTNMTYVDSGENDSGQHVGRVRDLVEGGQKLPVERAQLERILLLDRVNLNTPVTEEGLWHNEFSSQFQLHLAPQYEDGNAVELTV